MAKRTSIRPTWSEVKAAVVKLDRKQLVKLVADLYCFSKENQAFLHARFAVGDDPLGPYKKTINECMYPDIYSKKPIQISKAKRVSMDNNFDPLPDNKTDPPPALSLS